LDTYVGIDGFRGGWVAVYLKDTGGQRFDYSSDLQELISGPYVRAMIDLPVGSFAAIIFCTAERGKVDFKTRSKWARVLTYARVFKDTDEQLGDFIQRRGGINKCAGDHARILGRSTRKF
jgi:hypothetical protein